MSNRKNFIEYENFSQLARRVDGEEFGDFDVVYGDMSRLVVAWLAETPSAELCALYTKLGWGGKPNARAIHDAAKAWMEKHRPKASAP